MRSNPDRKEIKAREEQRTDGVPREESSFLKRACPVLCRILGNGPKAMRTKEKAMYFRR